MTGPGSDWEDPFLEADPDALERARRRAEREARRRGEEFDPATFNAAHSEAPPAPEPSSPELPPADGTAEQPLPTGTEVAPAAAGDETDLPPPPAPSGSGSGGEGGGAPPRGTGYGGRRRASHVAAQRRRLMLIVALIGVAIIVIGAILIVGGGDDEASDDKPVKERPTTSIVIPEGLTREQIAVVAADAGVKGDYMEASKSFKGFKPEKYGAEDPENLEGFLFPATYELFKKDKAEDLVAKQLDAFEANFAEVNMKYAESKNLTPYDVVIIASMIEREVAVPEERKKVGSVIYNRLSQGMALGIDATIRYGVGNFDEPLLVSELEDPTPYNTRIYTGLPPGPISNPGLASMEAAANPAETDFLYYVVNPNGCDTHVFSETDADAAQAVADYNAAREANGGKAPKNC